MMKMVMIIRVMKMTHKDNNTTRELKAPEEGGWTEEKEKPET